MQKVLLTGATGYIGSNIARTLLDEGYEVHIIMRPYSKTDLLSDIKEKIRIHVFGGSTQELIDIFAQITPYLVVHLAALYVAEHTAEDIESMLNSNIYFGTQVLEAATKSGVKHFINTGTYWQNYNGEEYNPVNLYAAMKQAFESILKYYIEISEMRTVTVKLIDTYGPFDPRPKIMSLLKRAAENSDKLEMSPGEQEVGFVYIDDVVRGFLLAIQAVQRLDPHMRASYVVAPDKYYVLKDVVKTFEDVYGKRINIVWGKRPYRKREILKINICEPNILAGLRLVSLDEGIRMMLEKEGKLAKGVVK
jgi:nucleoside-diphosphate-sugar epimerase